MQTSFSNLKMLENPNDKFFSSSYSTCTHQLVKYGEVVGVGQESAVSLRIGERSSVHAGEDAGERARRVQLRADATADRRVPLRGVQRSDVLIAELRERHAAAKGPNDVRESQISPLTRRIRWKLTESLGES